ncbi:MAG: hypothetical protein ACRD3Y_04570 [Bryobacteraceae bacterium]
MTLTVEITRDRKTRILSACVVQPAADGPERAIAELKAAFREHPRLVLSTSPEWADGQAATSIWWRDAAAEKAGKLAEVSDTRLVPVVEALIGELMRLRRGRAKGASA